MSIYSKLFDEAEEKKINVSTAMTCSKCRQPIIQTTANHTGGLCIRCYKVAKTGRVTILLLCKGCNRKYMLGVDAIMTKPEDVMLRVGGWMGGIPTSGSYPDIIGPLEESLPLDDEQPAKEKEAIQELEEAIHYGSSRKWRCFKCGCVQKYESLPV